MISAKIFQNVFKLEITVKKKKVGLSLITFNIRPCKSVCVGGANFQSDRQNKFTKQENNKQKVDCPMNRSTDNTTGAVPLTTSKVMQCKKKRLQTKALRNHTGMCSIKGTSIKL